MLFRREKKDHQLFFLKIKTEWVNFTATNNKRVKFFQKLKIPIFETDLRTEYTKIVFNVNRRNINILSKQILCITAADVILDKEARAGS